MFIGTVIFGLFNVHITFAWMRGMHVWYYLNYFRGVPKIKHAHNPKKELKTQFLCWQKAQARKIETKLNQTFSKKKKFSCRRIDKVTKIENLLPTFIKRKNTNVIHTHAYA